MSGSLGMNQNNDAAAIGSNSNDISGNGQSVRRGQGSSGPLERVTVNLIGRARRALLRVSERTGDTRTDCINRAIQVYDYLDRVDSAGGAIYVRESKNSELERLKMF
jgi:hypothetical protein